MIRTSDMTGLGIEPPAVDDLFDVKQIEEQANYYMGQYTDLYNNLNKDGRNRFRRAAKALRFLAAFIKRNSLAAVKEYLK